MSELRIGDCVVGRTKRRSGYIEMADYCGPLRVRVPFVAVSGRQERPLVVVMAAQHGREINGIEVVRRLLGELNPQTMDGTVVAIPAVNQLAVPMCQQDYPTEIGRYMGGNMPGRQFNMNRHWPGKPDGNLCDRVCHALMEGVIRKADFVIDLHGWTDNSLGMAWASPSHRAVLNAFAMFMSHITDKEDVARHEGYLEHACEEAGIPWLTAELTPQNRLSRASVEQGLRGVKNVLKYLGVLQGELDIPHPRLFIRRGSVEHQLKAEHSGLLSADLDIGTTVTEGDRIGGIYSIETLEPLQELTAPADGVLFNVGVQFCELLNTTHIVAPGQTVALVKEIVERL